MALKPCSACGKEVAVNARTCPHCGKNYPAPGKLFSVVYLLIAVPFLALGALLIYALIVAVLLPSPSAIVPGATPSVASDPDPACTYSDAEREIWPSVFATDESNPEGLMRQDELQSLPCAEQHAILTEVERAGTKDIRVTIFRELYDYYAKVNEEAKLNDQAQRGDHSDEP
jgi:hypothetical protein